MAPDNLLVEFVRGLIGKRLTVRMIFTDHTGEHSREFTGTLLGVEWIDDSFRSGGFAEAKYYLLFDEKPLALAFIDSIQLAE